MGKSLAIIGENAFYSCISLISINFLAVDVPVNVKDNWISNTPDEIRGHAYVDSNFPGPGELLYGLLMGDLLNGSAYYQNKPPIVNLNYDPVKPEIDQDIIFDVSWSYDPDGSIELYEWDWNNDGVFEQNHTSLTVIHSWVEPGTYPITLKVTDDSGANSTKTITVTVSRTKTPGFELIFVFCALTIIILIFKKKRNL